MSETRRAVEQEFRDQLAQVMRERDEALVRVAELEAHLRHTRAECDQ